MATIVCQGLQSCLDQSHLVEPRILRLKLSAPIAHHLSATPVELGIKSCFSESNHTKEPGEEKFHYEETISNKPIHVHENKPTSKNTDQGGWSFLQAVTNTSQQDHPKLDKENVYIPPQVYKSLSATKLTEMSLELCTEDLGCETGTIITESSIFTSVSEAESNMVPREQQKLRQFSGGKKSNVHSFPPPLTTISGSDSLQVRPHREDGRLVIKAVKAPPTQSCFQAERSNGRVRLCVLKNLAPNFDLEEKTATQEGNDVCENEACEIDRSEEEEAEQEDQEVVGENSEVDLVEKLEGVDQEDDADDEEEGKGGMRFIEAEEVDGNSLNVGGEEGMEKFERPSRCKEGGKREKKGLLNWGPFWVAT